MVLFLESSKAREGSIVHWILAVRPERAASSFETFRLSNDLRLLYFRRRVLYKYRRRHSEGNLIKVTSVGREYKGFLFSFANYFCLFRIFSAPIRSYTKVTTLTSLSGGIQPRVSAVSLTRMCFCSLPPIFLRRSLAKSLCNARTIPVISVSARTRLLTGIN